jgi:hypothetical protein
MWRDYGTSKRGLQRTKKARGARHYTAAGVRRCLSGGRDCRDGGKWNLWEGHQIGTFRCRSGNPAVRRYNCLSHTTIRIPGMFEV